MIESCNYKLNIFERLGLLLFVISPYYVWIETSVAFRDILIPFALIVVGGILSRKITIKPYHYFALLFWLESFLCTVIAGKDLHTTNIVFGLFVIMFVIITGVKIDSIFVVKLLDAYIIASVIISLLVILSAVMGRTYSGTIFYARYSLDSIGIVKNPNYLTAFFVGAYAILLFGVLFKSKGKTSKIVIRISLLLILSIACLLTGSRSSLLAIAVVSIFCLFGFFLKKASAKRRANNSILFLVLVITLCFIVIKYVPATVFNRLTLSDSYRSSAWSIAFRAFLSGNIITGFGINGVGDYISVVGRDLHSMILQVLFDQGIVGFFLFLCMLLSEQKRLRSHDLFFVIVLEISFFFSFVFNNGCSTVTFWFPIILIRMIINCCFELEGMESFHDYWQANSAF